MKPIDIFAALVVVLFWGINFSISKIGLQQLSPMLLMALRFMLVAALLAPFFRPPRDRMRAVAVLSVTLGLIHFPLMFTGLQYVDAAIASVVIQVQVPFSAMLAAVLFGDKLGWRRGLGMAIAIGGVAVLAGEPREGSEWWAVLLIVAAALTWSIANIQMKALSDVSGFAVNGWIALLAVPQLLIASLLLESGQIAAIQAADWRGWGSVVYQAVIVVILCYGIWYHLLSRYGVNNVIAFTLLVPVVGVIGGILILNEPFTWNLLIGGGATLVGVAIITLRRPRMVEPKAQNPT